MKLSLFLVLGIFQDAVHAGFELPKTPFHESHPNQFMPPDQRWKPPRTIAGSNAGPIELAKDLSYGDEVKSYLRSTAQKLFKPEVPWTSSSVLDVIRNSLTYLTPTVPCQPELTPEGEKYASLLRIADPASSSSEVAPPHMPTEPRVALLPVKSTTMRSLDEEKPIQYPQPSMDEETESRWGEKTSKSAAFDIVGRIMDFARDLTHPRPHQSHVAVSASAVAPSHTPALAPPQINVFVVPSDLQADGSRILSPTLELKVNQMTKSNPGGYIAGSKASSMASSVAITETEPSPAKDEEEGKRNEISAQILEFLKNSQASLEKEKGIEEAPFYVSAKMTQRPFARDPPARKQLDAGKQVDWRESTEKRPATERRPLVLERHSAPVEKQPVVLERQQPVASLERDFPLFGFNTPFWA